jgi:hypothetical protein
VASDPGGVLLVGYAFNTGAKFVEGSILARTQRVRSGGVVRGSAVDIIEPREGAGTESPAHRDTLELAATPQKNQNNNWARKV